MLGKAIPEAECWPTLAILKEILMSQSSPSCWFEVKLKFVFIIPSYELSVLGSESLTSPNIRHRRGQIPHLACPYGELEISTRAEDGDFGAQASFLLPWSSISFQFMAGLVVGGSRVLPELPNQFPLILK